MYLYKFIMPYIGIREPTPEKLKLPQARTSYIWLFHYLLEIGKTKLLTLPYPDKPSVHPFNKKMTFIWKQHFFQSSTIQ